MALVATCLFCDYDSEEAATEAELAVIVAKAGGDLGRRICPYCDGELRIIDTEADLDAGD